ncbi:InlB B-repeat-containing protein [Paenibacillus sp. P36]|uniref:InlB B-repeat-containing protein n=1 Tax=Paenibacillus sp. P36 TaxID=3342538 RepID=UPI0038B3E224
MDTWKFYADVANDVSEITVTPTAADADSKIEVNGVEVASGSPSGAIALNVGVNTIEILVTPAPPWKGKVTTLTVTRAGGPGSNTILNFLGLFLESDIPGDLPVGYGFNKSLPFYDFIDLIGQNKVLIDPQPEDSGATVTVNGIEATSGVKVPVGLLMGDNTITVVVTARDGMTTRTYTLLINRLPGADTSLIELGLNNGIPVVDPGDNKKYSVNMAYGVHSTRVYPVAKMDYATITVNGKSVVNGGLSEAIPLEVGSNMIAVVVTSEDGLAKTNYTLTVTRAAAPAGYKVKFVVNNGSPVEDLNEVSPGSTIARPESTNDGYIFAGWYKEWNYITLWDFDTDTVNANTTLYAKWTPTYTVLFDSQGGSSVESAPGILSGATVPKPSDPTRAGFAFSGWYADENFSSAWNFATDTVILDTWSVYKTLYAKWTAVPVSTYTVTFDSKDGSAVASATGIFSGETVTKPADPTRAGYTFSGWYKDEGYASAWNFMTDTVSANTTLYAKWTAVPVSTYTVTFDSKDGSAVASLTGITSGATVTKPADPTRAGYTFSGWYKDEGYASAWNFMTDTVSANTTLYAKWTAVPVSTYTVTFDSKDGSAVASLTGITSGATVTKPADPTRAGYTFSGWYKDEGYASAWNFMTDTVSANTTLYAKWTAVPVSTYTVTFDSKEGSAVASATGIVSGATVTKPADPTRAGYTFSGWYKDEGYATAWNFMTDTVSTNTTLYAKWTVVPVSTYTVTFDSKEGSAVASLTGITSGATVTKPVDPTRAGYTFSGWYKDEGYASAWNFMMDTVSANTTLYAKWTAVPVSTYTVTFDSKEGSAVAILTGITSGATVTKPADPTRAGYTFSGWYKDEGYASAWNFMTDTVSANTTLYAKWTAVPVSTYTVTFDSKEGSAVASATGITSGATVTKPADPTRAGYTFSGWYKDKGYVSGWNFTTDTVSANTTLYAKWSSIPVATYTVTFDSKEGSAVASATGIVSGATVTKPADPTRAGYTFSGWYKDEGYATAWNFMTDTVSANTTLYAKWTAVPVSTYTVTFDSKEGSAVASATGITSGATVTKPADPTRAGYTFSGWYKDEGYASAWNFSTDTVSANTTLYAKWTAVPVSTYTVTFDSKEGSAVASATGITSGATVTKPADPTRAGYTFSGWYKEEGYALAWNFSTDTVNVNTTLYAKWTAVPVSTYTVTFDSKEGSAVASATGIVSGATVTKPADPTRAGYTFLGWYKEEGYASAWNFLTDTVSANTTLYAKWTEVPSGGGSSGGVSVPDNSPVISDNGELTIPVGRPGTVSSSDDEITIEIPANATDASLRVTVETLLDTDELLKHNEVLVSEVFEVLKNVPGTFKKNITLKLAFDPTKLSDSERASIFYYDEEKKEWVEVGGVVSGGFITAEVNHFTKFAVLAVGVTAKPVIEFGDIAGHWAEEAIRQGASQGITAGYSDGTFKPNLTVTRAQFAVMLMNAIKPAGATEELAFEDASQIPVWANNAVAEAKQAGIITGYDDGTFRPNAEITRIEMAAMIVKALDLTVELNAATGFADNNEIPEWAKGAVAVLKKTGLMQGTGDNRFNSEAKASRAEAVTVLLRMLEQQKTKE